MSLLFSMTQIISFSNDLFIRMIEIKVLHRRQMNMYTCLDNQYLRLDSSTWFTQIIFYKDILYTKLIDTFHFFSYIAIYIWFYRFYFFSLYIRFDRPKIDPIRPGPFWLIAI